MFHFSLIRKRLFAGQQRGSWHPRSLPGGADTDGYGLSQGGECVVERGGITSDSCAGTVLEGRRGMRAKMARLWGDETRRASLTRETKIIAIGIAVGFAAYVIYLFIVSMLPVESSGEAILGDRFMSYW